MTTLEVMIFLLNHYFHSGNNCNRNHITEDECVTKEAAEGENYVPKGKKYIPEEVFSAHKFSLAVGTIV